MFRNFWGKKFNKRNVIKIIIKKIKINVSKI